MTVGKFAQNPQVTELHIIDSQKMLEDIVFDGAKEVISATILSDDCIQLSTKSVLERLYPSMTTNLIYNGI